MEQKGEESGTGTEQITVGCRTREKGNGRRIRAR